MVIIVVFVLCSVGSPNVLRCEYYDLKWNNRPFKRSVVYNGFPNNNCQLYVPGPAFLSSNPALEVNLSHLGCWP